MDVKGWWFVKYSRILAHPEKGMPPLGESCLQGRHGTLSGGPWNLRGGLLHRGTPSSPWVTIGAELWWLVDSPWLRKPLSIRRRSLFAPLPTPTPLPCPNLWGYFTMFVIATSFSVHLWGRPLKDSWKIHLGMYLQVYTPLLTFPRVSSVWISPARSGISQPSKTIGSAPYRWKVDQFKGSFTGNPSVSSSKSVALASGQAYTTCILDGQKMDTLSLWAPI